MTNATKHYLHYLFAAFTLGVSAFFFYRAGTLPRSAALLPKIVAMLTAGFSVAMAVQAYLDGVPGKREQGEENVPPEQKIHVLRAVCFVVMIGAYIYLVPIVGFFVMTPLYIFLAYICLKAVKPVFALLISILFTGFIYALFVSFLKLPVPLGFMESFM
jgi:hypothetical protein